MKICVFLAAAGLCASAASAASVMTFESLESTSNDRITLGNLYAEGGFEVYATPASNFGTAGSGSSAFYAGSSALHNMFSLGDTILRRTGGGEFSFLSIGLSLLSSNTTTSAPVDFIGTTSTGAVLHHSLTISHFGFVQYIMPAGWDNLVSVRWEQQTDFHQFDNITVSPLTDPIIPAPHAAAMGLLGLGGLAARRRR